MKIIVYGAGNIAKQILADLVLRQKKVYGVAVTSMEGNPSVLWRFSVKPIEEYQNVRNEAEIILGLSTSYHKEVIKRLKNLGFERVEMIEVKPIIYSNFKGIEKKDFLEAWYFSRTGRGLNWQNLCTYNEKMQWIKLYDRPKKKTLLADKYRVREYVKEKIGEKYLIPILGVWDCFDDIDFNKLPDQFVLKCNHGCGWNQIVEDKSKIDIAEMKRKFDFWMSTNYADIEGLELQYSGIERKILAEKYMTIPGQKDIPDYKIFVFNGEVKLIQMDFERRGNHKQVLYSPEWEYLPYSLLCKTCSESVIAKPDFLEEMLEISKKLSEGFRHVRVDLYVVDGRIYFGEMTFTHCSGVGSYSPEEFGYIMGGWLKIPKNYNDYIT